MVAGGLQAVAFCGIEILPLRSSPQAGRAAATVVAALGPPALLPAREEAGLARGSVPCWCRARPRRRSPPGSAASRGPQPAPARPRAASFQTECGCGAAAAAVPAARLGGAGPLLQLLVTSALQSGAAVAAAAPAHLGHERPLEPGQKPGAAPPADAALLDLVDDPLRALGDDVRRPVPVAALEGAREEGVVPAGQIMGRAWWSARACRPPRRDLRPPGRCRPTDRPDQPAWLKPQGFSAPAIEVRVYAVLIRQLAAAGGGEGRRQHASQPGQATDGDLAEEVQLPSPGRSTDQHAIAQQAEQ